MRSRRGGVHRRRGHGPHPVALLHQRLDLGVRAHADLLQPLHVHAQRRVLLDLDLDLGAPLALGCRAPSGRGVEQVVERLVRVRVRVRVGVEQVVSFLRMRARVGLGVRVVERLVVNLHERARHQHAPARVVRRHGFDPPEHGGVHPRDDPRFLCRARHREGLARSGLTVGEESAVPATEGFLEEWCAQVGVEGGLVGGVVVGEVERELAWRSALLRHCQAADSLRLCAAALDGDNLGLVLLLLTCAHRSAADGHRHAFWSRGHSQPRGATALHGGVATADDGDASKKFAGAVKRRQELRGWD
eukprot:scaffold85912_cov63-Phaeocystis_antarctica.AAC.2